MKRLTSFLACVLLVLVVVTTAFFWNANSKEAPSDEALATVESAAQSSSAVDSTTTPTVDLNAPVAESNVLTLDSTLDSALASALPEEMPNQPEPQAENLAETNATTENAPAAANSETSAASAEVPDLALSDSGLDDSVLEDATSLPVLTDQELGEGLDAMLVELPETQSTAEAEQPATEAEAGTAELASEPATDTAATLEAPATEMPAEVPAPAAEEVPAAENLAENTTESTTETAVEMNVEPIAANAAEETPNAETPNAEMQATAQAEAENQPLESIPAVAATPAVPSKAVGAETKPFDPIAENGEIFKDWPTPKVTLVLTGRLNGYMEPCGCAGMDRMMGGLSRRATFFAQLEEKGWNPVYLDTGGISLGFTKQAHMKFLTTVNMLREMGYDSVTLGQTDLNFPAGDLLSEASNPGRSGKIFTSSNVGLFLMDSKTLPPAKVIVQNGIKVGVVGVLGDEEQKEVRNDEIQFVESHKALDRVIPALKQKADFIVLLAHTSLVEARELASHYPDVDVIVCPNGPPVPPKQVEILPETGQYFVQIGEKGMHVAVLGLYEDENTPVRYQLVPMDSRFEASQKIRDLMALYQDQLAVAGLEGLGIRPLNSPYTESHGTYVGSQRCESCHAEAYEKWTGSRHAKAWTSLENSIPPRTSDPECIVCHVVGWDIKMKAPYQGGFLNPKETPELKRVGCESCHGPGEKHITAELGKDTAEQEKCRQAVRMTLEDAKKTHCVLCHDLDNSPAFDFDTYWKKIEHKTEE